MSTDRPNQQQLIGQRLAGRRLFVTGATGLLGKVFVEKLLRSVPTIGCVHLLIRNRADGMSGQDRLDSEVLSSSVFDRLRAQLGPEFEERCRAKVRVVEGDLGTPRFGLSEEAYAGLCGEIDIIINSAAAVTFDERLDISLQLNTLGPTRLLELARHCQHAPFMQVSTCYVSGRRTGDIPETLAPPVSGAVLDLDQLIDEMTATCKRINAEEHLEGEALRRTLVDAGMDIAQRHGWNDTYTFTKWLGEQLLVRERGDVPVVILRPAIIEGCFEEPVPGWIDGLRMADPMIMAFGRGKLREFPADPNIPIDIIPGDLVANAMIAALPDPTATPDLQIYQVASSGRHPLRVSQLAKDLGEAFRRRPMFDDRGEPIAAGTFRLVDRSAFERRWQERLGRASKLRRILEAVGIWPERCRKLGTMISQIEQVLYFAKIYSPYTHLDCRFRDDNLRMLAEAMDPEDRRTFPLAVEDLDWSDYIINRHVPGLRRFVLGGAKANEQPPPNLEPEPDAHRIAEVREQATSIFDAFQRVAALCGDKPALRMSRGGRWVSFSYQDILATTSAVARRLGEYGLHPGDRVALCAENCPEWGLTYLALMRAGLTAVPLDPQLSAPEILACARFAGARVVCAGKQVLSALHSARGSVSASDADELGLVALASPFIPPPGTARDPGPPPADVSHTAIASILFTSGTTVAPKAVPLTHANLLANARALLEVHPLQHSEGFVSVLPMYHAFEFTGGFLVPMIIGATVTYVEQLKGPEIMAAMQATRPTMMLAVPRLLKLFHDGIAQNVKQSGMATRAAFQTLGKLSDLSGAAMGRKLFGKVHRRFGGRLRMFISGGSALDPKLHQAFTRLGFEVCEGYGLTETSPVLTVNPPGRCKSGSIGQGLPGIDLEIRNANNDGVGELWARGPVVMQGYLDNPEASAEVLRDGWFRTGDLCRCDADGYYHITGRVKDMIVTDAGKNVYPDEVEVRYQDLPYVRELSVIGMPNSSGIGEAVHAVIIPDYDGHAEVHPSSIERAIREAVVAIGANIPAHQRIQTLHFWSTELPKTSTLKARRSRIREILKEGGHTPPTDVPEVPPTPAAQEPHGGDGLTQGQLYIRKLLSNLTTEPVDNIHAESNLLLDLGVDSLMKLQLIGELEAHFDLTCSNETAAALARVGDLFALVADHPLRTDAAVRGRSWRERQADSAPDSDDTTVNGRVPAPLLPARWIARGGMALFFRSYIRVRSHGLSNIPNSGPFLLIANHSSHLDSAAVLTAVAGRRRVWVAGAKDYFFNNTLKRWIFGKVLDTIPFDRHAEGYEGLSLCLARLEQGDGLLFFPEGTRSLTGQMAEFKIGAALMAVESGAPVIPARIEHAHDLLPKGRRFARPGIIDVTFGAALDPAAWHCPDDLNRQYNLYRELTQHLHDRVAALGSPQPAAQETR